MKVGVIGAGNMGGWARSVARSHEVPIGWRDKERGASRAKELGATPGGGYADAASVADAIILAVPSVAIDETLAELGNPSGKAVVDITNPYVGGKLQLQDGTSDAEETQRKVPEARVVKGWNTIFSAVVNAGPTSAVRRLRCSWQAMTRRPKRPSRSSPATRATTPSTAGSSWPRATWSGCSGSSGRSATASSGGAGP